MRKSVASLNIKCPLLRDCGWSGKLLEGEKHLKVCGSFLIRCPLGCDVVMKRYEMNNHLKTDSLNRETRCEFCDLSITYKNLTEHLLTCPAHSVVCECGRIIRRDKVKEHIDKDCELAEVECPYAKYSCKIGKIPRKDLLTHKKELYIEHQDMIERDNCMVTDELKNYFQKHDMLEEKYNKLKEQNDELVKKHNLLVEMTETENDELLQKHDLLEGEYDQFKTENTQLVQEHLRMEKNFAKLEQEMRIRKKLLGVTVYFNFKSEINQSSEFSNGQYRFVCIISLCADSVEISLKRLPTTTYSDKKVLSITECMLRLQENTRERLPYLVSERICLGIATKSTTFIMKLKKNIFSRYQQPDGIVVVELYFNCDCISYKEFFA